MEPNIGPIHTTLGVICVLTINMYNVRIIYNPLKESMRTFIYDIIIKIKEKSLEMPDSMILSSASSRRCPL